mmetsp:Transcript_37311/g.148869  ORF Transcript_37311/g.148869 Transcript_37311/m.148869 type:complete len:173 (-) Transcript_37311:1077-1595(-)
MWGLLRREDGSVRGRSMAANTLFDEVLESLVAEGGKFEKRQLHVVLERDVSGRELSLSLKVSDSKRPLFLLVFECGPDQYAELREKQRLKVEFSSFPVKLAGLLKECSAESHREPRLEVWVEEVDDVSWCLAHRIVQPEPATPIQRKSSFVIRELRISSPSWSRTSSRRSDI